MNRQPIPTPPYASVADVAAAQVAAGQRGVIRANSSFPTAVTPVAPANIAAPTNAVIALFAITPKVTGRIAFDFQLIFTDSAADTLQAGATVYTGVTNVSGGTTSGIFTWESSPITITGGAAVATPTQWSAALPAGGLTQTACVGGVTIAAVGTPIWLAMLVSAAHNLSAMTLNAYAYEI